MGVVEIVLIILAMKIPICGLLWLVWWAMKEPDVEFQDPGPEKVRKMPPRLPEGGDPRRRPHRRGPHGGQALSPQSPRRDPHPAVAPREPIPAARSTR